MNIAEAVREGSSVHDSRVVHTGKGIATAVYFTPTPGVARTQRGPRRGSGMVAVLDLEKLKRAGKRLIDLTTEAGRRAAGITPGSKEAAAAAEASEVLIDEDEVDQTMLVGELLDLSELARTARGKMCDVLDTIEDSGDEGVKGKVWLADQLYKYHEQCDAMQLRASKLPARLSLVTDASVQHPQGGVMAGYVEKTASAEQGAALRGTALRWRWRGGGGGGGDGHGGGEWRGCRRPTLRAAGARRHWTARQCGRRMHRRSGGVVAGECGWDRAQPTAALTWRSPPRRPSPTERRGSYERRSSDDSSGCRCRRVRDSTPRHSSRHR